MVKTDVKAEPSMMCFGWTLQQTAMAYARYVDAQEPKLPVTAKALLLLHKWWATYHSTNPLEVKIEGVEYREDWGWAIDAFTATHMAVLGGRSLKRKELSTA